MYNYLHGDQNAYLSSKIEETGKDISMSIKDMDANLGDKMDTLIDTINSKKEGLSADELQNVIDKGLEDLNKNTEDIKDNTSDILDTLKEQNNILLQILGVTEYIAYQNDKYNNTYTKADMSNLLKSHLIGFLTLFFMVKKLMTTTKKLLTALSLVIITEFSDTFLLVFLISFTNG